MNIGVGKTRPDLVEPFRNAVERSIREGGEVGIQVAAYSDSNLVVDIWAGIADPMAAREVKADTLFPTFSVIKAVTATALHLQVSRGLVDYDAPVARYWPEFAANGKGKLTVRHVLHHRSGVWQMPEAVTPERLADYDWMVDAIARLPPIFEPGTRNGYQGLTFGWMISEVYAVPIRKADRSGPLCRRRLSSRSGLTISGWVFQSASIRVSRA